MEEIRVPAGFELKCPQCDADVETIVLEDAPEIDLFAGLMQIMPAPSVVGGRPCNHRINGAVLRRTDGRPLTDPLPGKGN